MPSKKQTKLQFTVTPEQHLFLQDNAPEGGLARLVNHLLAVHFLSEGLIYPPSQDSGVNYGYSTAGYGEAKMQLCFDLHRLFQELAPIMGVDENVFFRAVHGYIMDSIHKVIMAKKATPKYKVLYEALDLLVSGDTDDVQEGLSSLFGWFGTPPIYDGTGLLVGFRIKDADEDE